MVKTGMNWHLTQIHQVHNDNGNAADDKVFDFDYIKYTSLTNINDALSLSLIHSLHHAPKILLTCDM